MLMVPLVSKDTLRIWLVKRHPRTIVATKTDRGVRAAARAASLKVKPFLRSTVMIPIPDGVTQCQTCGRPGPSMIAVKLRDPTGSKQTSQEIRKR